MLTNPFTLISIVLSLTSLCLCIVSLCRWKRFKWSHFWWLANVAICILVDFIGSSWLSTVILVVGVVAMYLSMRRDLRAFKASLNDPERLQREVIDRMVRDGNAVRIKDDEGNDAIRFTVKGMTVGAITAIQALLDQAKGRDFTDKERQAVLESVEALGLILQTRNAEHDDEKNNEDAQEHVL